MYYNRYHDPDEIIVVYIPVISINMTFAEKKIFYSIAVNDGLIAARSETALEFLISKGIPTKSYVQNEIDKELILTIAQLKKDGYLKDCENKVPYFFMELEVTDLGRELQVELKDLFQPNDDV